MTDSVDLAPYSPASAPTTEADVEAHKQWPEDGTVSGAYMRAVLGNPAETVGPEVEQSEGAIALPTQKWLPNERP